MTPQSLTAKIEDFFFRPASARPLAYLRIALSLCLLAQAYLLRGSVSDFLSRDGLIQGTIARALSDSSLPQMSWLSGMGFSESLGINAVLLLYLISVTLFGLGCVTRISSITTWLFHWVLMNTTSSTAYGVDLYAHVFLFYLMFMPCGDALSIDALIRDQPDRPSSGARVALRVLQIHLCIAYFTSALDKAMGIQWWNGELIWRSLNLPLYRQYDFTWLANHPSLAMIFGWSTLFLEFGYSIFIWPRVTRRFWIVSIVGLHLGISIFLGLGLFGVVMAVLTPTIFGVSAEPRFEWGTSSAPESQEAMLIA